MSIQKILVPTDFSECAQIAVGVATPLAKRLNAELLFLHFFPDQGRSLRSSQKKHDETKTNDYEISHVKANLDNLVRDAEGNGITAKAVLVYDRGSESIEDYAESYKVDLIVMGTHGTSGMLEYLAQSNAQKVTKNTSIPILALKKESRKIGYSNILFASSFEENVMKPLLVITDLAKLWNATIHLLYVDLAVHSTNLQVVEKKMKGITEQFPDNRFTINFSETNDEEFSISQTAHRLNVDLISLTPYERDGVIKMFSHSIAENLVKHEPLPVLVVPDA